MSDFMVWDADDLGANHIISDQCQSHDCRAKLDQFHYANPHFRATLFTIPAELTYELAEWCKANNSWIELAMHGIFHSSNYECADLTVEQFDHAIKPFEDMIKTYFTKGFKAPGWQISDGVYDWLQQHGWWVADQSYNNNRRPVQLPAYVNDNGQFATYREGLVTPVQGKHYHTWDCVGNGVYELSDQIISDLQGVDKFTFVSEALRG